MTLLSAYDILQSGYVDVNYPANLLCPHIKRKERRLFKNCFLGEILYHNMIDDLETYQNVEKYAPDSVYNENDIVEYNGLFLKSLIDNNNVSPDDDGYTEKYWKRLPKFKNECYNDLWEDSLKDYLILRIIHTSIRYSTYKATGFGLMKMFDDDRGKSSVSLHEFNAWKQEVFVDSEESLQNIYEFIEDNAENCNFAIINYGECNNNSCKPPTRRPRRRIFFKT